MATRRPSDVEFVYQVVDHKLYGSRAEFDGTIDKVLEEFGVELVCLAGFMRILTGPFVRKWNGKCLFKMYYLQSLLRKFVHKVHKKCTFNVLVYLC